MNKNFKFDLQRFADLNSLSHDGNTYYITSVEDLKTLSAYVKDNHNCNGLTFKQTQDIFFDEVADGQSNFTPIGSYTKRFNGTFDGGNFKISNLKINSSTDYQGLFGCVDSGGTVKDVHLVNVNVSGNSYVGGLVGDNEGTVSGIITGGTISGNDYVGRLVGDNYGGASTVIGNMTNVNVSNLVGKNHYGTVTEAYALTLPEGVTASEDDVYCIIGNVAYVKAGATVTLNGLGENVYFKDPDGKIITNNTYTMPAENTTFTALERISATVDNENVTLNIVVDTQGNCYYEISSVNDLKVLQAYVSAGNNCYGLTLKQTETITFPETDVDSNFTAIGSNYYNRFNGTPDDDGVFTVDSDTNITADVTAIVEEEDLNEFNAAFTATIVYGDDNDVIVLKDINKKPTKTGSSPIYQTNDVAAATLKIWDTSGSKQAVLSAAKLKKLFKDYDYLSDEQQAQVTRLSELVQPANIITTSGGESTFTNPLTTPLALNSNKPKD